MSLEEELARNASLKATLARMKAPADEEVVVESEAQKKAKIALKIIDLQEGETDLIQKVKAAELKMKHLEAEVKEHKGALKTVQGEIEKERSSGKAVWETCGISTVTYRDPFHTGLSKRTPTGAQLSRHFLSLFAPRVSACCARARHAAYACAHRCSLCNSRYGSQAASSPHEQPTTACGSCARRMAVRRSARRRQTMLP